MMLSAYFFYASAVTFMLGPAIGFAVALVGSILVALLIERVAIRPMLGRPFIAVVMVTFGIGSINPRNCGPNLGSSTNCRSLLY